MGIRETELPAVDAGLVPTQFVTGIRPPKLCGGVWIVEVYEERCGEAVIVARYAMTETAYLASVTAALAPVATAVSLLPLRALNG